MKESVLAQSAHIIHKIVGNDYMKLPHKTFYFIITNFLLVSAYCFSQINPELVSYNTSQCKEVYFKNLNKYQDRILKTIKADDFQTYNLFVIANCSSTEVGAIELKSDTLNFVFHGIREYKTYKEKKNDSTEVVIEEWTEELADCDCAFNISYKIKGLNDKEYKTTLNGKEITESEHKFKIVRENPSFKIIDKDTINYIDIYGLKQGLHIQNRKDGKLFSRINYLDDEKISGLAKTYYNLDGFDKIEIYMDNKEFTISKYYKNSEMIKICDTDGIFADGTNCKYLK